MKNHCTIRCRGWMLLEVSLTLTILALILVLAAQVTEQSRRFNRVCLARQQCVAAAQAQLDCLEQTGSGLPREKVTALWPEVTLQTSARPGADPWQGLTQIEVQARYRTIRPAVSIVQQRYVNRPVALGEK